MTDWISIKDGGLPPIQERFEDANYHGEVEGWFAHFYKHNSRRTCLWTDHDGDGNSDSASQRWMVNGGEGYGPSSMPPTHWRPYPDPPSEVKE